MASTEAASGLGVSTNALRAVAATSVALLVVGSGAALGMSGSSRPAAAHRSGTADLATGSPGSSAARFSVPVATVPGAPVTSTTVAGAGSDVTPADATAAGAPAVQAPSTAAGSSDAGTPVAPSPGGSTAPASGATGTAPAQPAGATAAAGSRLPAPGTYTYDTSGSQQISLLGSTGYPARTPITVAADGCGVASTWKPGQGNSETVVECPTAGGLRVVSETSTVGANGYSTTQTFTCDPNSFIPITAGQVGQTWTWQCQSSNGETATQVVKLVGPRTAVVGGIPVNATEVSVVSTLSGSEQGTMDSDYWFTSNATPIQETGNSHMSVGAVTFSANYHLQLVSLTPTS